MILLTDYVEESLVLLKEMTGWKYSDIMYLLRFYSTDRSYRHSELNPETEYRIRRNNLVDDQLYKLFHQLFRMKGPGFRGKPRNSEKSEKISVFRNSSGETFSESGLKLI